MWACVRVSLSVTLLQRRRADEPDCDSTEPVFGTGEALGAEGHVRVRVRLALIASRNKWRGQRREVITAHTVSVNRQRRLK